MPPSIASCPLGEGLLEDREDLPLEQRVEQRKGDDAGDQLGQLEVERAGRLGVGQQLADCCVEIAIAG